MHGMNKYYTIQFSSDLIHAMDLSLSIIIISISCMVANSNCIIVCSIAVDTLIIIGLAS